MPSRVVIGLPLGVLLGHLHRFSFLAINISNIGRALPSLAVLAILLPFLGIGTTAVIIALVVLAFPPILTNSYVAVDQVDADIVDAAKGIGLRPWQVLTKVELPLALPLIFAGIRTSAVFVVATATLAGFFGGGGLGNIINNQRVLRAAAARSVRPTCSSCWPSWSQGLFVLIERLVTPVGLRQSHRAGATQAQTPPNQSGQTDAADDGGTVPAGAP